MCEGFNSEICEKAAARGPRAVLPVRDILTAAAATTATMTMKTWKATPLGVAVP